MESQPRGHASEKASQTRLPTPPPTQPLRVDPVDHKRKREEKGKEVVEIGKTQPSQEIKPQRGAKQPKVTQTRSANEGERKGDHRAAALAWAPCMKLDGAPLLSDASIPDFQQGTAGYVANAMEQSLLLPKDMADLKSMRQHKVFLGLKRDLAMVSLLSFFFLLLYIYIYIY